MLSKNNPSGIGSVINHREREKGVLVYPVYSRRSGGLSLGVNLFPGKKSCSFDCPYCEVFPFSTGAVFSGGKMEADLRAEIASADEQNARVRDICFSGNGEPSMSPDFPEALERAGRVRADMARNAELVLITNGTGLLDAKVFSLLRDAATGPLALDIWLKLDAGTPDWYKKMNRCDLPFERLVGKIKEFSACASVKLQTMICAVDNVAPPPEESAAWEKLVVELVSLSTESAAAGKGGSVREVQIYGKARPASEDPKTAPLPDHFLEERAASLRAAFIRSAAPAAGNAACVAPNAASGIEALAGADARAAANGGTFPPTTPAALAGEKYGAVISAPKVEVYP